MRVEILHPRTWQDAGERRPLNVGDVADLPDVVAVSLIATGAARSVDRAPVAADAAPAASPQSSPERKPQRPRERK